MGRNLQGPGGPAAQPRDPSHSAVLGYRSLALSPNSLVVLLIRMLLCCGAGGLAGVSQGMERPSDKKAGETHPGARIGRQVQVHVLASEGQAPPLFLASRTHAMRAGINAPLGGTPLRLLDGVSVGREHFLLLLHTWCLCPGLRAVTAKGTASKQ